MEKLLKFRGVEVGSITSDCTQKPIISTDGDSEGKEIEDYLSKGDELYLRCRIRGTELENGDYLIEAGDHEISLGDTELWKKYLTIVSVMFIWVGLPLIFGWGLWLFSWIPSIISMFYLDKNSQRFMNNQLFK